MTAGRVFQGSLFAEDFPRESITGFPDRDDLDDGFLDNLETYLHDRFDRCRCRCVTAGGRDQAQARRR